MLSTLDAFAERLDSPGQLGADRYFPRAQNEHRHRSDETSEAPSSARGEDLDRFPVGFDGRLGHLQLVAGLHAHDVAGPMRGPDQGYAGGIRAAAAQGFQHAEHGRAQMVVGACAFFGNSLRSRT